MLGMSIQRANEAGFISKQTFNEGCQAMEDLGFGHYRAAFGTTFPVEVNLFISPAFLLMVTAV